MQFALMALEGTNLGMSIILAVLLVFAAVTLGVKSQFGKGTTGMLATASVFLLLSGCSEMDQSGEQKPDQTTSEETQEQADQPEKQEKQSEEQQQANESDEYSQTSKPGKTVSAKNQVSVKLSRVVDGDTIKVFYKGKEESVRYLLIDTPESKKPGECVQPYAEKASKRNEQLIKSGKLTLEFEKSETDKYGRLLAYVFVDGKSVQETLIKEGLGRVAYIYEPPYKYLKEYEEAEELAKKKKANIWSKKGLVSSRGFNGCANVKDQSKNEQVKQPQKTPAKQPAQKPADDPAAKKTEHFQNCTELRKQYPNGVPKGHPAYQLKMDRDKDDYACER